jgi:pimeloyl-ACP methyl ester carboxylesterase
MGGNVALELAAHHPETTASIVLIDSVILPFLVPACSRISNPRVIAIRFVPDIVFPAFCRSGIPLQFIYSVGYSSDLFHLLSRQLFNILF